jgi:hypothetical protein
MHRFVIGDLLLRYGSLVAFFAPLRSAKKAPSRLRSASRPSSSARLRVLKTVEVLRPLDVHRANRVLGSAAKIKYDG